MLRRRGYLGESQILRSASGLKRMEKFGKSVLLCHSGDFIDIRIHAGIIEERSERSAGQPSPWTQPPRCVNRFRKVQELDLWISVI
jgi:hypothetical protein